MTNPNIPNLDPANNYSLVGVLQTALNNFQQNLNGMLPAKVINYDRESNQVSVQLMVNIVTTGGQQIERAQLSSIPVFILGAGQFSISFPLQTGDVGWVLANDRDISLFLQSYNGENPPSNPSPPNTGRMCNFADSVFFPDIMKSYNISSANENYMIIQSNDGTMTVEMGIDSTNNNAPSVNILAGTINLNLNDPVTQYVRINGNLWVSGLTNSVSGGLFLALPEPPYAP